MVLCLHACDISEDRNDRHQSRGNVQSEIQNKINPEVSFDYYPRGRVSIYEGTAFIHLNSKCNTPKIVDAIIKEYGLYKLEIEIEFNDDIQGSHYNFSLK